MTQDRTPMNLLLNPPLFTAERNKMFLTQLAKLANSILFSERKNRYASAQRTGINIETHGSKD